MRKILEILRLKFQHGLSGRAIALAVCAALSTVQDCLRRFAGSGLTWPVTLDEAALEALLYPQERVVDQTLPDFAAVAARLSSFKGMTRERVWQEYRQTQPEGLSYSAFCASFARFLGLQKLSAKQFHAPGSAMFVDYAGPALFITDGYNGVRTAVRVFVAALGYSHAIFACATPGERTVNWLDGHVQALHYFGGVPEKIVPDNAKGLVPKTCRYEPVLNPSYIDFARHYDCAVVPGRVRRPQDKAKVENAVQILERALFPELMAATFFDIESLNSALREGIDRVNAKPFQKRDGSRHSRLLEEREALKPLPVTPYEFAQWKRAKVQLDYHVADQTRDSRKNRSQERAGAQSAGGSSAKVRHCGRPECGTKPNTGQSKKSESSKGWSAERWRGTEPGSVEKSQENTAHRTVRFRKFPTSSRALFRSS